MKELKGVKVYDIEEGCGFIKCPKDEHQIQVLEKVISECPTCKTKYTMKQVNLVFEVEG